MATDNRSYTAGSFELAIDGHPTNAYLKSVEGGHIKGDIVTETVGTSHVQIKHMSTREIEPFTMEIGMAGSEAVLRWIQGSWRRDWSRRNGQITHADFDLFKQFEHEFYEALIQETTFPALDGGSKESAYLKVKVQPEHVVWKKSAGNERVQPPSGVKQKMWLCNAFRLTIDSIDDMRFTNKIEAFTIKQGIQKLPTGKDPFPQIEPTSITFPNITGSIALEHADGLLKWHDHYIQKLGQTDPDAQKSGSLEFLSPDRKDTIFRLNFYEIGLASIQMPQSQANSSDIKRVKFDLYVGRMDLDGPGGLGME